MMARTEREAAANCIVCAGMSVFGASWLGLLVRNVSDELEAVCGSRSFLCRVGHSVDIYTARPAVFVTERSSHVPQLSA
jgi:hypothetical protein